MPSHTITYSAERDVAEVDFRDRFVAPAVIPIICELKRCAGAGIRKGIVWNLKDADLSDLTIEGMRDIFRVKNEVQPNRALRIACVVAHATDANIVRLWAEGFSDSNPHHRRWFYCRDEAHAWVRAAAGAIRPAGAVTPAGAAP